MAASPVYRRYTSAVYEDKFFPEKNAAIPFKWEATPGRPKDDDDDHHHHHEAYAADEGDLKRKADAGTHNMMSDQRCTNYCKENDHHVPHAVSVYPLRPPPKLSPVSPLRVKDLLQYAGGTGYHDLVFDDDEDDQLQQLTGRGHCPLHTYHHSFSRLSFQFRSRKASAVVPIHKKCCVIKPRRSSDFDKAQASALVMSGPSQGRSQSFSHSAYMHREPRANQADCNALVDASLTQAPGRRCNSFNPQSARHRAVTDIDNDGDDHRSVAAAAMWTGACILAAAVAHDVISGIDTHRHNPCKVAMKLRDLMQQSANFSELGLPSVMKIKNGGHSTMDENLAQLALCHAATAAPVLRRKTKSMEEEVMEAFLREGIMKSCAEDDDVGRLDEEKATLAKVEDHPHDKLVKSKGFFKLFRNECIACWCPSSTQ